MEIAIRAVGLAEMRWVGMLLVATLAVGCGDDTAGTGGGGQGGSGQGGSGQGGSGGGQGGSAPGSGGGGASCESDAADPIAVVIRNDSSARIWFQQTNIGGQSLGSLGGIAVDGEGSPDCACDALEACSVGASVSVTIGFLEPGGSFEGSWTGLFYDDPASRPACQDVPCAIGVAAPPGTHEMGATAFRGAPFCDVACECDLASGQTCSFGEAAGEASDPIEVTASFSLPAEGPVTIAFTD